MTKTLIRLRSHDKGEQKMTNNVNRFNHPVRAISLLIIFLSVIFIMTANASAETIPEADERGWVDFILVCNEGMRNDGGNSGNTMMLVSMNPKTGMIKLLPFCWDTFIQYPGYDVLQRLDKPFRNIGPQETMSVFNYNFNMDIKLYMSLNFTNLASLIDTYGGVDVDVEIAERNALNQMVASKKEGLLSQAEMGLISQTLVESLVGQYYLNEFGPETHLNGMQAVGFGWLQYDSTYNCCLREVNVIKSLFISVGNTISPKIVLYTDESGEPENVNGRRAINLDNMTEDDQAYLSNEMATIFQKAAHNLSEENIQDISNALARTAYLASRQGVNVFEAIKFKVLPLEATKPYDLVAGTKGHCIDYKANEEAIKEFLFTEEDF